MNQPSGEVVKSRQVEVNSYAEILVKVSELREQIRLQRARILSVRPEEEVEAVLVRLDGMQGMLELDERWIRQRMTRVNRGFD